MGRAFSSDLRDRISDHLSTGHSRRDAARRFGVSPSCAIKLVQHVAKTGSAAPARQGRPPGAGKLAPHMAKLIRWVEAKPDISMPELAAKLAAETQVIAHPASLSRARLTAGFKYKNRSWRQSADAMTFARRGDVGGWIASRACASSCIG